MFTIIVETSFKASHRLTLPDGSKEAVHYHNWTASAKVSSEKLNRMGLVMDFYRLRGLLDRTVFDFSGIQLEQIAFFRENNSSAENVAKYIYEKLQTKLPKGVELDEITVIEEPGCLAKFEK